MPRYLQPFATSMLGRLQAGEHLLLYGPRGTGKSTLLSALHAQLRAQGMPCGTAPRTGGLADIIDALRQAYPHVTAAGASRHAMVSRLRLAAQRRRGVLLLDHGIQLSTAMIGLLRKLRGGMVAVLLCVDTDVPFEWQCARAWRRHALGEHMPLLASRQLRRRLCSLCTSVGVPLPASADLRYLVRCARGRVGWLEQCARRLHDPAYWRERQLCATTLCIDIEMALRATPGPRLPPRLAVDRLDQRARGVADRR